MSRPQAGSSSSSSSDDAGGDTAPQFFAATMGGDVEYLGLVTEEATQARTWSLKQHSSRRLHRRGALGVTAALGCLAAIAVVRKAVTPCATGGVAAPVGRSIVELVKAAPDDLLQLGRQPVEQDAVARFLLSDSALGGASVSSSGAGGGDSVRLVYGALMASNSSEAKTLMQNAMGKAGHKWVKARRDLIDSVPIASKRHLLFRKRTPAEEATVASCTFDALQATTQLAALATSINDAAKTCVHVGEGGARDWPAKICAINVEQIIASMAAMAASLSLAAHNCAQTLYAHTVTNLDALCSGAISGLVQSLMEFSISAELTASGCGQTPADIPEGHTPSTVGQGSSASARRLLFGGGMDAASTFCAVDVTSVGWYLAQAGIAINTAANPKAGKTCPPPAYWGGSLLGRRARKQAKGFCAVNVAGAIYGFLQAAKYINLAAVHCSDTWDPAAVCGAGIDGLLASADGLAYAGSATWLACDEKELRRKPLPPLTRQRLKDNALGNSGSFGRRLSSEDAHEAVAELSERFATPVEAWKSMGYDIESPDSELRQVEPRRPSMEEVVDLVQAPEVVADDDALFNGQHLCS